MKTYTLSELKDEAIGVVGTPYRDEYEAKLKSEMDEWRLGEAMKQARINLGLTQDEIGERIGIKKSQVSLLEKGRNLSLKTIKRIFVALGAETATIDFGEKIGKVQLW